MTRDGMLAIANGMKPGQAAVFDGEEFQKAFGWNYWGRDDPVDAFLSGCIGSAYGVVRVSENLTTGDFTITRHEPDPDVSYDGFLYHVDVDRRAWFERVSGGWERKHDDPR